MQVRYLSWDFKTLPPGVRKSRAAIINFSPPKTEQNVLCCCLKQPNILFYAHINSYFMFSLYKWTSFRGGEKGSAHRAYELMIWCGNGCIHSLESSETQSLSYSCSASSANLNQILKIVTEEKYKRKRRWEKLEKLQKQQRRSSQ